MSTSELTGPALDWAVAKCEGSWILSMDSFGPHHRLGRMNFSTDWSQGGPIIERVKIELHNRTDPVDSWSAFAELQVYGVGPTPLIAAMRCYVASMLGDNVEIPEVLK